MALSLYFLQLHIILHLLENCSSQINNTNLYYKGIFIGKQCKTTDCKRKGQIYISIETTQCLSEFCICLILSEALWILLQDKITMISNK